MKKIMNLEQLTNNTGLSVEELKQIVNQGNQKTGNGKLNLIKFLYDFGAITLFLGVFFFIARIWVDLHEFVRLGILILSSLIFLNTAKIFSKKINLHRISQSLYVIGIILTVSVFIQYAIIYMNHYEQMNSFLKIFFTLGVSIIPFLLAVVEKFKINSNIQKMSTNLIIYAIFMFAGAVVLFDILVGLEMTIEHGVFFNLFIFSMLFLPNLFIFKTSLLSVLSFLSFNALYINISLFILKDIEDPNKIIPFFIMILAVIWLIVTRFIRMGKFMPDLVNVYERMRVADITSAFGSIGLVIAAFDTDVWEFLVLISIIVLIFLSQIFYSKIPLVVASITSFIYISYITAKYFIDAIGFPLALIFIGIFIIALGYFILKLKNRISVSE